MLNEPQRFVTKEEVQNSYEFKLTKKIVLREFPWIKDIVLPSDEEINNFGLIFCSIYFDPIELQKQEGWPFGSYMKFYFNTDMYPDKPYYYISSYLSTIYAVDRNETIPVQEDIESTMRQVSKSPAIPSDLKLGKERYLVPGEFAVLKVPIPPDAVFAKRQPD